jgi:alkylation response protein AidB-like acyl-CoA dehydrogenase
MTEALRSPVDFLSQLFPPLAHRGDLLGDALREYDQWWQSEGRAISDATDRAGTPWLKMFDHTGARVDEIFYAPEYWGMLQTGYRTGVLWRAFEENSFLPAFLWIYVTSFYDPGLACPYTVSLATAAAIAKHGTAKLRDRFLPNMLRRDGTAWQGATWMTEIKGGSDLGANVETKAAHAPDRWSLTGDKYFASNAGAELAVVAARPEGAPAGVKGVALFLVPRRKEKGSLNYLIRRLKDKIATRSVPTGEIELRASEAWLLGQAEQGIYNILEVLNLSRVANSFGSVAVAQRALAEALRFAGQRIAFGKPILQHALLRKQFAERERDLSAAAALAWEAAKLFDEVREEHPPYSAKYHLFRLVAHLAKSWTAELAVQTAKWGMEVHGGLGVLGEFRAERWLREAMILAIWEGTSHRQALDGLEVIERKQAHRMLFEHLSPLASREEMVNIRTRVDAALVLAPAEREARADLLFDELARFTAATLARRHPLAEEGPARQ